MAQILIRTLVDSLGSRMPTSAILSAWRTSNRVADSDVMFRDTLTFPIVGGEPARAIVLEDPPAGEAWNLSLRASHGLDAAIGGTYVWPAGQAFVEWADLEPIDPRTLEPLVPTPPSVLQVLSAATSAVALATEAAQLAAGHAAALPVHIAADEPHPAYDEDTPSLRLLFENGLI